MTDKNISIYENLRNVQSLRAFLKSEMSINGPDDGKVAIVVKVHNDAYDTLDGGHVVFFGVGLCANFVGQGRAISPKNVKVLESPDHKEWQLRFNRGTLLRHNGTRFPEITSDEQSHGDALFPGESVVYEIQISEQDLPYLDVRVEGYLSRRHLFHVSQSVESLRNYAQPLIAETFSKLNSIDIYSPLYAIAEVVPEFGPQTTLADLAAFKAELEKSRDHVIKILENVSVPLKLAPDQQLRDYIEHVLCKDLLVSAQQVFNRALEAISGDNSEQMRNSAEEIKALLVKAEKVERGQTELMAHFGID